MKINIKQFARFLELINVSGSVEIKECIMIGDKKNLRVTARTPSNTFALTAKLKGDFSELETVGIDDLALLRKVISLNDEEVDITRKENTIIFKNKTTKAKLLLRNPKYILTALEEDIYMKKAKAFKGNEFTLRREDIDKIAKYYEVFKGEIFISGSDNVITFIFGEAGISEIAPMPQNTAEVKIAIKEKVKSFNLLVAGFLIEALIQIKEDVTVSANTDMPMIINAKTDYSEVEYLVAPLKRLTTKDE